MSHILIVATLALFPFSSQSLSVEHALHIFASFLAAYLAPSVYSASLAWRARGWVGWRPLLPAFYPQYKKSSLFLPPLRGSSRIKEWSTGCKICGWGWIPCKIYWVNISYNMWVITWRRYFGIENGLRYQNAFNAALHWWSHYVQWTIYALFFLAKFLPSTHWKLPFKLFNMYQGPRNWKI